MRRPGVPLGTFLMPPTHRFAQITAVTTGLGALPLIAFRKVVPRAIAWSHSAAAGMCLAASVALSAEGYEDSPRRLLIGLALGYGFVVATRGFIEQCVPAAALRLPGGGDLAGGRPGLEGAFSSSHDLSPPGTRGCPRTARRRRRPGKRCCSLWS